MQYLSFWQPSTRTTARRLTPLSMIILLTIALLAHLVIFVDLPLLYRTVAVLALTGLLPGILLVEWLVGRSTAPPTAGEHLLYSIGAGYAIIVVVMLLLSYLTSYLSSGLAWWQTLPAFDLTLLLLLLLNRPQWIQEKRQSIVHRPFRLPSPQILLALLTLALIGGFFRFADLGYSEFQGDEARALLRAAEVIQGHPDALLGHKKGPAEILIPALIYSLTGQIDETSARLPFAFANFAALFALFLLGTRLFGLVAGWSAAMLLAMDGYFIGFAHIVQYQSIVFLTVLLAVLIFVRLANASDEGAFGRAISTTDSEASSQTRWFTLAAILLATGLLSHYEAALVIFPCLYLLYRIWRNGTPLLKLARALTLPAAVGALLVGSFYLPFVRNPNFAITYAYITVNRLGVDGVDGGATFPYNNLVDVFNRTMLYSSSYYLLLLVALSALSLALVYWRGLRNPWRTIMIALLFGGLLLTAWRPTWLQIGARDQIWVFFALLMLIAWSLPRFSVSQRTIWIWFAAPMILSLFFTRTPNTHVYGFFIAWALIAGMMIERIWRWLLQRLGYTFASAIAAPVAMLLVALFGTYEYWYFVYNDVEILRTWQQNRPDGYWVPYQMPTNMSVFGFPFRNGWKTVGMLYAEGALDGAFDTNGRDAVGDWYTRGAAYCPRDHKYFIYSQAVEPAEADGLDLLQQELEEEYGLWGRVLVNGEPRLHIYERGLTTGIPRDFADEEYENAFDRLLSGANFERAGSIAPALARQTIQHKTDFLFGSGDVGSVSSTEHDSELALVGFSLERETVAPGDELEVTLYWRSRGPTALPYTVFNQLIDRTDNHKVGQRDGEPVCNRMPTTTWLPGDLIADRYRIAIAADARPGKYTWLMGVYARESGQRLPIFTADGNELGDALGLIDITVEDTGTALAERVEQP